MRLSFARARLELKNTFRIARSADDFRESIIVRIEDEGLEGFGEAAPSPRYGQSANSVERALASLGDRLCEATGNIALAISHAASLLRGEKAALAAVDIALHDLLGKKRGAPLHAVLGLDPRQAPVTSYTIGIDTADVIAAKVRAAENFPVLKIKMGLENDREIMETVRGITSRTLRVDANEGWTREEAIEKIRWLEDLGVELIEQPLPADDLDGARRLAERSRIPIFADESVRTLLDIPKLAGAFHGINIKLMKCGGIDEALRMIASARACGLRVMLGCMIESSVGITAAAQISPLADYADLDGNILIRNDPAAGVATDRGKLILPDGPGLGVTIGDKPLAEALRRPKTP